MDVTPQVGVGKRDKLRRTIMARRQARGQFGPAKVDQGYKRSELTPEELAKKERRREQNRRAAQRCRTKKRLTQVTVIKNLERIVEQNRLLQRVVHKLRWDKDELIRKWTDHRNTCPCFPPSPDQSESEAQVKTEPVSDEEDAAVRGLMTPDELQESIGQLEMDDINLTSFASILCSSPSVGFSKNFPGIPEVSDGPDGQQTPMCDSMMSCPPTAMEMMESSFLHDNSSLTGSPAQNRQMPTSETDVTSMVPPPYQASTGQTSYSMAMCHSTYGNFGSSNCGDWQMNSPSCNTLNSQISPLGKTSQSSCMYEGSASYMSNQTFSPDQQLSVSPFSTHHGFSQNYDFGDQQQQQQQQQQQRYHLQNCPPNFMTNTPCPTNKSLTLQPTSLFETTKPIKSSPPRSPSGGSTGSQTPKSVQYPDLCRLLQPQPSPAAQVVPSTPTTITHTSRSCGDFGRKNSASLTSTPSSTSDLGMSTFTFVPSHQSITPSMLCRGSTRSCSESSDGSTQYQALRRSDAISPGMPRDARSVDTPDTDNDDVFANTSSASKANNNNNNNNNNNMSMSFGQSDSTNTSSVLESVRRLIESGNFSNINIEDANNNSNNNHHHINNNLSNSNTSQTNVLASDVDNLLMEIPLSYEDLVAYSNNSNNNNENVNGQELFADHQYTQ